MAFCLQSSARGSNIGYFTQLLKPVKMSVIKVRVYGRSFQSKAGNVPLLKKEVDVQIKFLHCMEIASL